MHEVKWKSMKRPGLNEIATMVLLIILTASPIIVGIITGSWIVAIFLAFCFWFSVARIIQLTISHWKSGNSWEWPRIVGGPSIKHNRRRY